MFAVLEKEKIVAAGMFVCFLLSIGIRLFLNSLYRRLLKETGNMATTQNKLLKKCKLKFMNCYQLNNGLANVSVFVDKFLNQLCIGPFSFRLLYHLSGQCMLFSVISSGIGVCRRIMAGSLFGEILPFYVVSLVQLYAYFLAATLTDVKGKREALKTNLVDFLENHLCNRMQLTGADMQMLYGIKKSVDILPIAGWLANREPEGESRENGPEKAQETAESHKRQGEEKLDAGEKEELEMLLKEILTLS